MLRFLLCELGVGIFEFVCVGCEEWRATTAMGVVLEEGKGGATWRLADQA